MRKIPPQTLAHIASDREVRRRVARESHWWFFCLYFAHYIRYAVAPFHYEMFRLSEDVRYKLLVFMAFRGSGKSTIYTLSYVLWAILGKQQKKCVLIISRTQVLVATHMRNIRQELESNKLLRDDLGPFKEEQDKYGVSSIALPFLNARIMGASREQSIRGVRHGEYRPDLVICDDLEDSSAADTPDERNSTYHWFQHEVVPVGDKDTRIIVLGNLIHERSLLMRLRDRIAAKEIHGIFRAYPLLDNNGRSLWRGKFKSKKDIALLRANITDREAWHREYMLVLPYDEIYDRPEYADLLQSFYLKFVHLNQQKEENIFSTHLHDMGFEISAPYGGKELEEVMDQLQPHFQEEERKRQAMERRKPVPPRLKPSDDLSEDELDSVSDPYWPAKEKSGESCQADYYDFGEDDFDPYSGDDES